MQNFNELTKQILNNFAKGNCNFEVLTILLSTKFINKSAQIKAVLSITQKELELKFSHENDLLVLSSLFSDQENLKFNFSERTNEFTIKIKEKEFGIITQSKNEKYILTKTLEMYRGYSEFNNIINYSFKILKTILGEIEEIEALSLRCINYLPIKFQIRLFVKSAKKWTKNEGPKVVLSTNVNDPMIHSQLVLNYENFQIISNQFSSLIFTRGTKNLEFSILQSNIQTIKIQVDKVKFLIKTESKEITNLLSSCWKKMDYTNDKLEKMLQKEIEIEKEKENKNKNEEILIKKILESTEKIETELQKTPQKNKTQENQKEMEGNFQFDVVLIRTNKKIINCKVILTSQNILIKMDNHKSERKYDYVFESEVIPIDERSLSCVLKLSYFLKLEIVFTSLENRNKFINTFNSFKMDLMKEILEQVTTDNIPEEPVIQLPVELRKNSHDIQAPRAKFFYELEVMDRNGLVSINKCQLVFSKKAISIFSQTEASIFSIGKETKMLIHPQKNLLGKLILDEGTSYTFSFHTQEERNMFLHLLLLCKNENEEMNEKEIQNCYYIVSISKPISTKETTNQGTVITKDSELLILLPDQTIKIPYSIGLKAHVHPEFPCITKLVLDNQTEEIFLLRFLSETFCQKFNKTLKKQQRNSEMKELEEEFKEDPKGFDGYEQFFQKIEQKIDEYNNELNNENSKTNKIQKIPRTNKKQLLKKTQSESSELIELQKKEKPLDHSEKIIEQNQELL
ncbi:stress-induced-phosphoprotein [Anaeramoeba ignava]|uniref:Stress-induced-phosphoprotein n=1 Tax=Anaeramoeba ignava TaxID=1746090 RepID=A0A9Q0LME4_ANAIG|nr:stress-induced-phosphoprotein [Anaeramoeba ignava]